MDFGKKQKRKISQNQISERLSGSRSRKRNAIVHLSPGTRSVGKSGTANPNIRSGLNKSFERFSTSPQKSVYQDRWTLRFFLQDKNKLFKVITFRSSNPLHTSYIIWISYVCNVKMIMYTLELQFIYFNTVAFILK